MAIGLSDPSLALGGGGFAPPLPRAAVDALARLEPDALHAVVAAAAAQLTQRPTVGAEAQGDEDDSQLGGRTATVDRRREATAAAACLLGRCARELTSPAPSLLRQAIEDCGVDDEALLARLVPVLHPHVAATRAALRATSFDFAHVVDVSWRLDYVLRGSAEGNVHEPVYYVQLKVQPPQGAVRDVTFACSVEGLRDLVYRLQDATNTIEKIATPSTTLTQSAAAVA